MQGNDRIIKKVINLNKDIVPLKRKKDYVCEYFFKKSNFVK